MKSLKVFFSNSFLTTCYYVRCMVPMREAGWWGDKTSRTSERISPEAQAKAVMDADVVVFHRPNDERSYKIAEKLKAQGKKIVADNDDTYKGLEYMKLGKVFQKIDQGLDAFVSYADLVTCSTEFLAEEYRKLNKNVVVLPNCIDPEDWPDEDEILRNEGDKIRIGISGSVGLGTDISHIKDVIEELSKRKDVQLVLFALPPKNENTREVVQRLYKEEYAYWESIDIEWQPFVPIGDYMETLNSLKLDMMLIPRKDDYFNRCKSNIKFLECSMLEIPVIAQGFRDGKSPYQQEGEYMKIVIGNGEWLPEIEAMIRDKNARRKMGKKAREYVLGKYTIADNIHLWEEAYSSLYA